MKAALNYVKNGSGPANVWLHGLLGNYLSLYPVAKKLKGTHFMLDLRNHGKSFHHPDSTYKSMSEDLIRFLDSIEIDKVGLIGHSMGGKVAMTAALLHPDRFDYLVILDIAPLDYRVYNYDYITRTKYFLQYMNAADLNCDSRVEIIDQLRRKIRDENVVQLMNANLVAENGVYNWRVGVKNLLKSYMQLAGFPKVRRKYEGPTLVLAGEHSLHTNLSSALVSGVTLEGLYKNHFPDVDVRVIPKTGHWLHVDKPQDVISNIEEFTNSLKHRAIS